MIPGAPICWHQTHPNDGFSTRPYGYPDKAFKEYQWDVLTLQPFVSADREIPAALRYANLLWANSPKARVYIRAQWPNRKQEDWEKAWFESFLPNYDRVLQGLCDGTNRDAQAFVIPAGHARYRLQSKMALGLVPGYRNAWDLYQDGVHVNNVGSYPVGLSFYATIFGRSPVGVGVGGYQGAMGTGADYHQIGPDLARVIQETVWEAVTAHPDSGVRTDAPVAVTLPVLLPAVVREPYSLEIVAALGKPPYTWSTAGGQLPEGVALQPDGFLKGSPVAEGAYTSIVKVTDAAGQGATRRLMLDVGADTAPRMVTDRLPELRQGRFVDFRLQTEGGNGVKTWAVTAGELPKGLVLESGGRVQGSPAAAGDYAVTLTATGADRADPESDARAFTGTTAPADLSTVFFARHVEQAPTIDGRFDAGESWDVKAELKKPLVGRPSNEARFDAVWHGSNLYLAVEVQDANIVTAEGWGKEHYLMDCLVFYFDGLNNREATYNFDDRRLAYGPTDRGNANTTNSIGPRLIGTVRSQRTPQGFTMEAQLKLAGLGVPDQIPGGRFDAAGAVLGFDLVNRDVDVEKGEQTHLGWQGTAHTPDDPSQFGTLILRP